MNLMTSDSGRPSAPEKSFIVVSGCNGVGKSTVAQALRERLDAVTFHYPPEFVQFRDHVDLDTAVSALPRLLYYLGATLHLSDLVRRQLSTSHVICDRYIESPASLLIAESAFTEGDLDRLCDPYRPYLYPPTVTLFLTASYEVACQRIRERVPVRASRTEQRVLDSPGFYRRRETALRGQVAKQGLMFELDTTTLSPAAMCGSAWAAVAGAIGSS